MAATLATHIPDLPAPRSGKVREIYDLGERVLVVATDRISAFDVVMGNGIPDKGRVLNQLSAFWFEKLADVCANHMLAIDAGSLESAIEEVVGVPISLADHDLLGRSMLARKARPLPIECVVRGYLAGSLFKEYRSMGGEVHGLALPDGLSDGSKLAEPIFTPATKAEEGHDENISWNQAVNLVGRETADFVRDRSLELYRQALGHAESVGLILADTKFEFGWTEDGVIWIDEALTPDSSRYWSAESYKPGGAQPSFDKQFVRDYLETLDWDKRPPGPVLPDDIVERTRGKYIEAFRRLTGQSLGA